MFRSAAKNRNPGIVIAAFVFQICCLPRSGLVAVLFPSANQAVAQSAVEVATAPVRTADALTGRLSTWYEATSRRAPGQWGIAVADESGRMLWSMNPDQPMVPASTVKLFTTGFARSVLGGTARRSDPGRRCRRR